MGKGFEASSSFLLGQDTAGGGVGGGGSSISVFQGIYAGIGGEFQLGVGLGARLSFYQVLEFSWYFLIS